ncbi:MAG: ribonuclease Z [Aerococcus sp.]|nr:ribonuclease Z [Aerococcus sp.]
MKLTFLGTGAGLPSRNRNVSSLILKLLDESNEMWMFDCGEGTQHQLLKTTLKPRKVSKIFITHLHGDHLYGLPGFLASRGFQGGENDTLTLYGPRGLGDYIRVSHQVSQTHLNYKIKVVELGRDSGIAFENEQYKVTYGLLNHGIRCYGYRVEEAAHPGELLIDKARAAGVPNGPLLGKLKQRERITLADGTILDGNDFVGPDQPGHIVTIFGDTRYHKPALPLIQDADVLVHEATYAGNEATLAHQHFHSTAKQAAMMAKAGNVKQLYLNHISARYLGRDVQQLQRDAQSIFKHSTVVKDFDEFTIK